MAIPYLEGKGLNTTLAPGTSVVSLVFENDIPVKDGGTERINFAIPNQEL
jgi:hypothetical protein